MNDVIQKSKFLDVPVRVRMPSQWAFTCSKSIIETVEQDPISVQS